MKRAMEPFPYLRVALDEAYYAELAASFPQPSIAGTGPPPNNRVFNLRAGYVLADPNTPGATSSISILHRPSFAR
jgi:hypothetical protein